MTQRWDGPTPYDLREGREISLSARPYLRGQQEGYRNAMNSKTVRRLYEAVQVSMDLAEQRVAAHRCRGQGCGHETTLRIMTEALVAYKKDLEPELGHELAPAGGS